MFYFKFLSNYIIFSSSACAACPIEYIPISTDQMNRSFGFGQISSISYLSIGNQLVVFCQTKFLPAYELIFTQID